MSKIIISVIFCTLYGCNTLGERFKALDHGYEDKSLLYIYMSCVEGSTEYSGGGQTGASLYLNEEFIGYLSVGTYIPLILPKGEYKLKFGGTWNYDNADVEFKYSIDGGNTLYFEWDTRRDEYSYNKFWYEVFERSPLDALPKLQHCLLERDTYTKAIEKGLSV